MTRPIDSSSFEALWQQLAPQVRALVYRQRWPDAALAADDLVQEVRIRLWKVYQGDTNQRFRASYYYKVINSAILDCLRKHRGVLARAVRESGDQDDEPLARLEHDGPGPDELLDREFDRARLLAAIDGLPAARARAVRLYLQGFAIAEIAELMDCDLDRAHNLTYRGTRELKRKMGG